MKQVFSYETKSASGQRYLEEMNYYEDGEEGEAYEISEDELEENMPPEGEEDYEEEMTIPVRMKDAFMAKSIIDPILERYGFESYADEKGIHIPHAKMMGPILVGELEEAVNQIHSPMGDFLQSVSQKTS